MCFLNNISKSAYTYVFAYPCHTCGLNLCLAGDLTAQDLTVDNTLSSSEQQRRIHQLARAPVDDPITAQVPLMAVMAWPWLTLI